MFLSCPICQESVLSSELHWHVNNHFVEDELERDMELAQQLALAPPSPTHMNVATIYVRSADAFPGRTSEPSSSDFSYDMLNDQEILILEKASLLVSSQIKSTFYEVEGGLMPLLRRCLELESGNSRNIISGHVDHYQSIKYEDSGWGCGWRNIQMLSSHLLMQREEARDVMFGGSRFVPDIPSLQKWLEIAWDRGFDTLGSDSFNCKIYGTRKWIGTTECATLFRSFGLRARVVDFDSIPSLLPSTSDTNQRGPGKQFKYGQSTGRRKMEHGPMDKFVNRMRPDDFQFGCSLHEKSQQAHHDNFKGKGEISGHQVLVDWVWNYFASDVFCKDDIPHVYVSKKTPLYFQHDGHSRTIVGIQMQKGHHGLQNQYFLLVLDPSERTAALESSLRDNFGWQKHIKRGVHTLKKPQYQLCYVDPGIANEEEMEQLKTIDSILVKF